MLQAAAREVVEETTLDHTTLQFYPRCFMTTDAIYNDDMGAVKYHFVISHVSTSPPSLPFTLPPSLLSDFLPLRCPAFPFRSLLCVKRLSPPSPPPLPSPPSLVPQMVCWAAPEAAPVAADDAKDIRWMTLPQLRTLDVRREGGGRKGWRAPTDGQEKWSTNATSFTRVFQIRDP